MPSSPSIQDLLGRARRLKSELSQTSSNASPWSKQAQQALDELCNIEAILQDYDVRTAQTHSCLLHQPQMGVDTQSTEYQGLVDALQELELDTQRTYVEMSHPPAHLFPGYAPAPTMQPAPTRLAGASSMHLPQHGPGVAAATERARTGSLAPLPRINSHSWLSEHLHPPGTQTAPETARETAPDAPSTSQAPVRPGRSPFDLDTQPLVSAFPIQPSASISVHEDPLHVRARYSFL